MEGKRNVRCNKKDLLFLKCSCWNILLLSTYTKKNIDVKSWLELKERMRNKFVSNENENSNGVVGDLGVNQFGTEKIA